MFPQGISPFGPRPTPPSSVSCFACRRVKKLCDKALPCSRCRRLGLECIPQLRGRGRPWGSTKRKTPPGVDAPQGPGMGPIPGRGGGPLGLAMVRGREPSALYGTLLRAVDGLASLSSSGRSRPILGAMSTAGDGGTIGLVAASTMAFDAIIAKIREMRSNNELDQTKVDTTRDSITCLFPNRTAGFQGSEMLQVMLPSGHAPAAPPEANTDEYDAEAGGLWARELLTTPETLTMIIEYSEVHLQVTCNDLMSKVVVTSEELFQEAMATQSLPAVVFAGHMRADSVPAFYEAMTACQYGVGKLRERNALVQVRARAGDLLPCLATCRCHWRPHITVVTARFWPMEQLLALSSDDRSAAGLSTSLPATSSCSLSSSASDSSTGGGRGAAFEAAAALASPFPHPLMPALGSSSLRGPSYPTKHNPAS